MQEQYITDLIPLTRKEAELREKLEEKIFTSVRVFYIELGETLSEINERKLYKSTHHCFEDYSREVLDMARRTAYQYINAYGVARNLCAIAHKNNLSTIADKTQLPQNEAQARALVPLSPEEQIIVWQTARETAPDGKITAAHIRATVRELGYEKMTEKTEKAKRAKTANGSRLSKEFDQATTTYLSAIQQQIDNRFKDVDRITLLNHLDGVRAAISGGGNHRVPDLGYSLEASNMEKLHNAGFTVFRMNESDLLIEKMVGVGQWEVVGIFEDKRALKQEFDLIMLDLKNIRG